MNNVATIWNNALTRLKISREPEQRFKVGKEEYTLSEIKQDPGKVMIQIMKQASSSYAQEIENWISAKDAARHITRPRRDQLDELYTAILEDGFIWRQVEQRALRITKTKFRVVDYKTREVNADKTDLFQKPWFKEFIRLALDSRAHGQSLIFVLELLDGQINKIDVVERGHVVPEQSLILKRPSDTSGVDYTKPPYNKFTLFIGKAHDLGYLNKLAPIYILKKHSWAAWDQFEEMFGLPIRWAKTEKTDSKSLGQLEAWLQSMGKASYGIFPKDTEFEIKESTRADAYQVFDMKRKACNEEAAITVNGQTMTTMDGSSRSQAEVHQDTQDDITVDDLDFIQNLVNYDLMRFYNYHLPAGEQFTDQDVFEWDLPEDLLSKLKIYQGVKEMGFDLDQDEVSKVFGVTITGKTVVPENTPPPKK